MLKEEYRRENILVHDHLREKAPVTTDPQALARSLIRGCRAEVEAGIRFGNGGRSLGLPKTREEAVRRCANYNLKVRMLFFLILLKVSRCGLHP